LIEATGIDDGGDDVSNYKNLDWDDVRALDEGEYEVGGHTVNHEIMAYLNDEDLEYEIGACLTDLAENLGHSVDLFSYPEGQADHYDERVVSRLKAHGIKICPSAMAGINPPGTDPFHLRRIMVGFMGHPFPVNLLKAGPR
jgi:peptidoglycan/xylan/chitin deacetylase (PgdA/CDA1 family)